MSRLAPLLMVASLLAVSSAAVADQLVYHERDEDAVLVGAPGVDESDIPDSGLAVSGFDTGLSQSYRFDVTPTENLLRVQLHYDPGNPVPGQSCARLNDLNLEINGPHGEPFVRYAGCDQGFLKYREFNVPTGNYEVTVSAEQGTTVCLPVEGDGCSAGAVDYVLDIKVYRVE